MSGSFIQRYWEAVKKCCCPCRYKDEDQVPLIGKVWDNYFKPAPEPGWTQLPKSVKETVKRTSDELQRYASARKSGDNSGEFSRIPTLPSEITDKIGKNAAGMANAAGGLIFGQKKDEE